MHIGLDTVQLKGRGFTARVKTGDVVRAGDVLIDFDADYVATHARSLMTEVIITSTDRIAALQPASGSVKAGTDTILNVTLTNGRGVASQATAGEVRSGLLAVSNPSGLHARPAAVLTSRAKQFASDIRLRRGQDEVNAAASSGSWDSRSRTVIASSLLRRDRMPTKRCERCRSWCSKGSAKRAPRRRAMRSRSSTLRVAPNPDDPNVLAGVSASPGIAVGNVVQVRHEQLRVVENANDVRAERQALDTALEHAKAELDALHGRLQKKAPAARQRFSPRIASCSTIDLLKIAGDAVSHGKTAAFGWQLAFTRHADRLASLKNELLAARANDLRDVGRRVLQKLTGVENEPVSYEADSILVAEELTPSDTASLNRSRVLGLCTTLGGASSHVAILARALDLPLVVGADPRVLDLRTARRPFSTGQGHPSRQSHHG